VKRLLDTSAYSAWKRGYAPVVSLIRECERLYLSSVVVGELLYGFRSGSRLERNRRELEAFLADPAVELLEVGRTTADRYSRIAAGLRSKGRPIPTNDIWIAAHSMEVGAELVSLDEHFSEVDGLVWVRPAG